MTRAILERLLTSLGVVLGAVTLVFVILHWLPGDPATMMAGEEGTAETVRHLRAELGTDKPLAEQYLGYLGNLARGDLGRSWVTKEPVLERLASQLPSTLSLTLLASGVALFFGITLGVLSARHHGRWLDQAIQSSVLFLVSMPSFWLGMLLILVFAVTLNWLPVIGSGGPAQAVLPVLSLTPLVSGPLVRMVRDGVLEGLHEPYVTTLRAKGLSENRIFYLHVLRNALIPTVTLLGVLVGALLSGTVVTETMFARQGIGRLVVEAVNQKDIPMVQGAILLGAIAYVGINLLVDLSYLLIDPRVRA